MRIYVAISFIDASKWNLDSFNSCFSILRTFKNRLIRWIYGRSLCNGEKKVFQMNSDSLSWMLRWNSLNAHFVIENVEYFFIDSKIPALKYFQWQSRNQSRDWPNKYLRFRSESLARVSKRESWAPKPKRWDVSVDHSDVSARPWNQDVELLIFCKQLTHFELMAQITTRVFHFYSQIWAYALIFIALAFP